MESSWKSHSLWCVNVNVPRVVCLPTDMKTCGGNEVLHTGPHTPGCGSCCFDAASLLVSRWKSNPLSQTLTVNILPLYTTHGGAGLSPRHLSFPFFMPFYKILVEFSCFLPVYINIGDVQSIFRDDNWLLGCICDTTCLCLGSGSWSMTPDVVWWRRICKRNVMNGCRRLFEHVDCIKNKTKMFKRL